MSTVVTPHILLVDDEQAILQSLELVFERSGYKISTASNGSKGMEAVRSWEESDKKIDLIITDLHMPVMDGLEMIGEVRKLERRIPVLVITGFGDKKAIVKLIRLGADNFIDKPFKIEEIREKTSEILSREKKIREKEEAIALKAREDLEAMAKGLESYRRSYEKLSNQVSSAKDAYKNLITIREKGYKVKMTYRIRPLAELGGDFFDLRDTDNGCDVFLADVSGHDMGASYNTVLLKAFFDQNCRTGKDGASFFRILNKQLIEINQAPRMVTAVFARFNLKKKHVEITTAAHPPVCMLRGKYPGLRVCEGAGGVLGIDPDAEFGTKIMDFTGGDRFFFYTDGLPRAQRFCRETGKKVELSEAGIDALIMKNFDLSLDDMIYAIWEGVLKSCNQRPNDDMLLMGVEV